MGAKKSKANAKNPYGQQQHQNGVLYPGGSYYQQQPQYYQQQPQLYQSPSLVLPPPPPPHGQFGFNPVFQPQGPPHGHHQRRPRGPRVIDEPPIPLNY